jgi:hypothetical protein
MAPTPKQQTNVIKAMVACAGVRSVVGTVVSPSMADCPDAMDVDDNEVVQIPTFGLSPAAV